MNDAVNIRSLLDNGAWTRYQKAVTTLAALATIFDGFDIQILGFTIPSLMSDWQVSRSRFGLVLATGLIGMALGSLVAGYIGDRFGRRTGLIGSVVVFGIATAATAFVHGLVALTLLRFLTGLGTGGALPNVSALSAEFAPLARRAVAVKLAVLCVPLGGMVGGALATWVLPRYGWRDLYLIGGGLPLALAALLLMVLPESPRFLARFAAEEPRLIALLSRCGHFIRPGTRFEEAESNVESERKSLIELFASGRARDTVGLWIAFFFGLGAIYLVFGWLPAMLTARGLDAAAASSGLGVFNLGGVVGVLIWSLLVPIFGSRRPLVGGALACAASSLALLLIPVQIHGTNGLLIVWLGLIGLMANAVQTSMYALAAHVYPTRVRATGVAYSVAIGRVGGLLSSLIGAAIIQAGASIYWQSLALAMVFAAIGLAWVRNHYPATSRI